MERIKRTNKFEQLTKEIRVKFPHALNVTLHNTLRIDSNADENFIGGRYHHSVGIGFFDRAYDITLTHRVQLQIDMFRRATFQRAHLVEFDQQAVVREQGHVPAEVRRVAVHVHVLVQLLLRLLVVDVNSLPVLVQHGQHVFVHRDVNGSERFGEVYMRAAILQAFFRIRYFRVG